MKQAILITATIATLITGLIPPACADDGVLDGMTQLACEALLCLSSSVHPGACSPSLSYYFGIVKKTMPRTLSARLDFLNLCPVASQTPAMQSLVSAISQGAGRCDTDALNQIQIQYSDYTTSHTPGKSAISNQFPPYCTAYYTNSYTDFVAGNAMPKYVGIPERGGYWVDANDYPTALAAYNARIAAEDRLRSETWR